VKPGSREEGGAPSPTSIPHAATGRPLTRLMMQSCRQHQQEELHSAVELFPGRHQGQGRAASRPDGP